MYPHSARMDDAVKNGGKVSLSIAIFEGYDQVGSPAPLRVTGGSVIADIGDSRTRRCTIELVDDSGLLVPSEARDLFSPLAAREFTPYRGFLYSDGKAETIPQGNFLITSVNVTESTQGLTISVSGTDDAERVSRNKYVIDDKTVVGFPPGWLPPDMTVSDAIQLIWADRFDDPANLGSNVTATDFLIGPTIPQENADPWEMIKSFASSIGWRVYVDNDGYLVGGPIPDPYDPNATVAWQYHADGDNVDNPPIVQRVETTLSIDQIFNGAVAVGSNSYGLTPPRAVVWDTNPASPTYYRGSFPRAPYIRPPDEKILTPSQAVAAATGDLNKYKGLPQVVQINQMVHPALVLEDIIRCDFDRSGIHALYSIDRIEMPLAIDAPMVVKCRERRILG